MALNKINKMMIDGLDADLNSINEELIQKAKKQENYLIETLRAGTANVLLVGDSITAGVGSPNYSVPPTNPIIFTDTDGTVYREADYINGGWANWFRYYLSEYYPTSTFRNIAIGGKSTRWWYDRRNLIFTETYDTVFVALGANDRWDTNNPTQFKQYLTDFITYLKLKCNYIVLICTPIHTKKGEEIDYMRFSMEKINKVIKEVSQEQEIPLVDTYTYFKQYIDIHKVDEYSLIHTDGVHPNNGGYYLMWENIKNVMNLQKPNDQTNDGIIYVDNTIPLEFRHTTGTQEKPFFRLSKALNYIRALPKGKYKIHIKQGNSYVDEGDIVIKDCDVEIISSNPSGSVNIKSMTVDNANVNFNGYLLVIDNIKLLNGSEMGISKFYNGGTSSITGVTIDGNSKCRILDFTVENKQTTPFEVLGNSVLEIWNIPKTLNNNNYPFTLDNSVLNISAGDLNKITGTPNLIGSSLIAYNNSIHLIKARTGINSTTPASSFQGGKITIVHYTASENGGFPELKGGTLVTDLSVGSVSTLARQYFYPALSDNIYVRHWNGTAWATFKQVQITA